MGLQISLDGLNSSLDPLHLLFLAHLWGPILQTLLLPLLLALLLPFILILLPGILANCLVSLSINLLQSISLDIVINVAVELALVALFIIIGQSLHVFRNVSAEDVLSKSFSVELFGFDIVAREAIFGVRNEDATVGSTLHSTEDTSTSRCTSKTDIEEAFEGATILAIDFSSFGKLVLSIRLFDTSEMFRQIQLAQGTTGDEEPSSICRGPISETMVDTVALELVGVGCAEDLVPSYLGCDDLADDIAVGEADNKAVFRSIVFVLGLADEALTSVIVGFTLTATLVLNLVAAAEMLEVLVGGIRR